MQSASSKSKSNTVSLSMEQYDKAFLQLEIAKSFFNFVSDDIDRDDSIFLSLDGSNRQALLCGISCLLHEGTELLTKKEVAANDIR